MIRGVNAMRCTLVSGGSNFWNLIASLYYVAKEAGEEAEIKKLFDENYPYVCTCKEEIENIQELLGGKPKAMITMSGCSELVQ